MDLVTQLKISIAKEKKATLEVLNYLWEMERKRVFTRFGYDSLFTFLVKEKLYSESEALLRISAMRCMKRSKVVEKAISQNKISLTSAAMIQRQMKNKEIENKKKIRKEEIEKIVKKAESLSTREVGLMLKEEAPSQSRQMRIKVDSPLEKKISTLYKKLGSEMSDQALFEYLLNEKLTSLAQSKAPSEKESRSRYIAKNDRVLVAKRSGNCCEYRSENGKRCQGRYRLQLDHIIPLSKGGMSTYSNLQHLCFYHNNEKSNKII